MLGFVGLVGVVLATTAFTHEKWPRVHEFDALASLPMSETSVGCEYHCRDCGANKHDIVQHVSTNEHKSSHLETCNPGTCDSHSCGGGAVSVRIDSLWNRLLASDIEAVQDLLVEEPGRLRFNRERKSLQLLCPLGTVVANLPLHESVAAALDD